MSLKKRLESLSNTVTHGISLNECELAASVPELIRAIRKMETALRFYMDEGGGPYAPGDYFSADGGVTAKACLEELGLLGETMKKEEN